MLLPKTKILSVKFYQIVHVNDYYQQNPPSSNHDNLFFKYPTLIDRMRLGTGTIDFISSHLERCKSVHKDIEPWLTSFITGNYRLT